MPLPTGIHTASRSASELQAALAALQATKAIAAKTGEAGKILGKVGGVANLALGSPEAGAGLRAAGGLLQFAAGQEKHEYGYKLLGTLIPLIDKKIEEKKHQPGDCMIMLKSCKQ